MSKKLKILVLTDHRKHSVENSLYALLAQMCQHPQCGLVEVASRGNTVNESFFYGNQDAALNVHQVDETFGFDSNAQHFLNPQNARKKIGEYDFVFLRLPRPIPEGFFVFLESVFPAERIINRPSGIQETSSKAFLTHFADDYCPPLKVCQSVAEVENFAKQFPIVLKPLESYGGKGIVKLEGDTVWENQIPMKWENYKAQLSTDYFPVLAVKYLKNVSKGDKRILVVNQQILGASLRLPATGSWMCNVAQGGQSVAAKADANEVAIVQQIAPILLEKGILIFGLDTLENDEGKRIISEINTLSIGGFPQAEKQTGKPIVKMTVDLIFEYFNRCLR